MAVTLTLDWPTEGREAHANIDEGLDVDVSMNVARAGNISQRMLPGWRWTGVLAVPDEGLNNRRSRQKVESLMTRWVAGANRMRLYNVARPTPLGTMRGTVVTSASAAKGATSIQVSGALPGTSLMPGGGMELDSDVDGISDGMFAYSAGSTGTVTHDRTNGAYGKTQRCYAAALGTSTADRVGLKFPRINVSGLVGSQMTLSCDVRGSYVAPATTADYYLAITWLNGSLSSVGSASSSASALPNSVSVRASLTDTVPTGAVYADLFAIARQADVSGNVGIWIDRAKFEVGSVATEFTGAPTLLDGDLIGVAGQRVMVSADVTLTDLGAGTVNFWPPLRYAIGSGTVVEWDRPKVLAVPKSRPLMIPFQGTKMPGFSVEWVEAWEAPA